MYRVNQNVIVINNNTGVKVVAKVTNVRYGTSRTYDILFENGSSLERVSVDSNYNTFTISSADTIVYNKGVMA